MTSMGMRTQARHQLQEGHSISTPMKLIPKNSSTCSSGMVKQMFKNLIEYNQLECAIVRQSYSNDGLDEMCHAQLRILPYCTI